MRQKFPQNKIQGKSEILMQAVTKGVKDAQIYWNHLRVGDHKTYFSCSKTERVINLII